jgi:hypothetical protein
VVHCIQQRLGAGGAGDGLYIKRKTRHLNRLRAGPVQCTVCPRTTAVGGSSADSPWLERPRRVQYVPRTPADLRRPVSVATIGEKTNDPRRCDPPNKQSETLRREFRNTRRVSKRSAEDRVLGLAIAFGSASR